ncbi:unnamed protein product [Rhizoctonia solani]|uniref:Transmembrane protein n=1 Tax=Rhizoctonia solani TaxID=456999 RepID=A0A8H2ZYE9_9AGAM|nr:unnamed protein product [Rhizoctonia solani]
MLKCLLATYYLFSLTVALANHAERSILPENAITFYQVETSASTRTARLRATLPIFELVYGRNSEYQLGRALEEYMLVRGRPLSTMAYNVEPDLGMFDWLGYDRGRRVLSGIPPVAQPLNSASYLDIYVYIGSDRSHRLRTVLGIVIRDRNDTRTAASTPTALASVDEQVPQPRGVVLKMLIAACVLLAVLILGGLGWMVAMRGYFSQTRRPMVQSQSLPRAQSHRSNSRSLPSSSNRVSSITSTRRRVRTADHGTPSPSRPALELSPEQAKGPFPPGTRKRAATLLQTIHTRAIRGSPKIGFTSNKASPSSDISSTTGRKGFSPRLGLGQFSPRLEIEDRWRKGSGSLAVMTEESPGLVNSWSSALRLDPFHSPERKGNSVDALGRKAGSMDLPETQGRPASPTPNKGLCIGGNKTMSVSELFRSGIATDSIVDDSGVSSDRYDHAGNLGFMDNTSSAQTAVSTQVTPQAQPGLTRAESYAERTNQLGLALLSLPASMYAKPTNGALGIGFDSFFSPATGRPLAEPRYGEVSCERMVRIGHSQETLTTAYVTASESGVSPTGEQPERDSTSAIPEEIEAIGSPSILHLQVAGLDHPSLTVGDLQAARVESPDRPLDVDLDQSLSVEYGRADRSLRALDSFPLMLRGSLSCFPEDVSLNTLILPSTGSGQSQVTHREAFDIMLLPTDDSTQGCLVLTRVGDDSGEHEENEVTGDNTGGISFIVAHEASNLVGRSEGDSILSPDLSEHATEQTDSIISREQDSNMRSSVDSIVSGRRADRSSSGLKFAAHLFLSSGN